MGVAWNVTSLARPALTADLCADVYKYGLFRPVESENLKFWYIQLQGSIPLNRAPSSPATYPFSSTVAEGEVHFRQASRRLGGFTGPKTSVFVVFPGRCGGRAMLLARIWDNRRGMIYDLPAESGSGTAAATLVNSVPCGLRQEASIAAQLVLSFVEKLAGEKGVIGA
jgi:hypothetical protein